MNDLYLWQNRIFDLSFWLNEWVYRRAYVPSVVNTVQLFWSSLKNETLIIKPVWRNIYERHAFYLSIIFLKLIKLCVELAFIPQRIIWRELLFGLSKMWISIILQRLSTAQALISIYEDIHFKFTKIHEVENVIIEAMNEPVEEKLHMSERLC